MEGTAPGGPAGLVTEFHKVLVSDRYRSPSTCFPETLAAPGLRVSYPPGWTDWGLEMTLAGRAK